jgi:hypothetical protein
MYLRFMQRVFPEKKKKKISGKQPVPSLEEQE